MDRYQNFTVLIGKINRNIKRIKSEEMKDFDLKSPHVSCLYYLYKQNHLTAKELADICEEDKASISRSLEYLENNGYIVCNDTKNKKRYKSFLKLTEKGVKIGKQITEKIDNILILASKGINDDERIILYKSLTIISENLDKIVDKGENTNVD